MRRPDLGPDKQPLPPAPQEKRTVVPLEREHWDAWLHGNRDDAAAVIQPPRADLYVHGAVDPDQQVALPA